MCRGKHCVIQLLPVSRKGHRTCDVEIRTRPPLPELRMRLAQGEANNGIVREGITDVNGFGRLEMLRSDLPCIIQVLTGAAATEVIFPSPFREPELDEEDDVPTAPVEGILAEATRSVASSTVIHPDRLGDSAVPAHVLRLFSLPTLLPAAADTKQLVESNSPMALIPALLIRADEPPREGRIGLFRRPRMSPDGDLVLDVKPGTVSPNPDEHVVLELLAEPDGRRIAASAPLHPDERHTVTFSLPPELKTAWLGVEKLDWSQLPFRFIVRGAAGRFREATALGRVRGGEPCALVREINRCGESFSIRFGESCLRRLVAPQRPFINGRLTTRSP